MNNLNNKLLTREYIENIIFKYTKQKIKINSLNLIQQAFIQKSFFSGNNISSNKYIFPEDIEDYTCCFELPSYINEDNECLEFIGDRLIDMGITEYIYFNYETKDPGVLTRMKINLVQRNNLSFFAEKLGFKEYLLIDTHLERLNVRHESNIERFLEDLFEAFIGVLFIDQNKNHKLIIDFLKGLCEEYIDLNAVANKGRDSKTRLQEFYHSKGIPPPEYKCIDIQQISAIKKKFTVIITITKETLINVFNFNDLSTIKIKDIEYRQSLLNMSDTFTIIKDNDHDEYIIALSSDLTKKQAEQTCSKQVLSIFENK